MIFEDATMAYFGELERVMSFYGTPNEETKVYEIEKVDGSKEEERGEGSIGEEGGR